jgi:hypothetical protein
MKIRKLLPILILAAAALVALSGCDAMLEGLFPSLKQSGTNSVTVSVDTFLYGVGGVGSDISAGDLVVALVDDSTGKVVGSPRYIWLPNYNHGLDPITLSEPIYFGGLFNRNYTAYAWIDADGDNQPISDFDYNLNWGATSYSFPTDSSISGNIQLDVYQYGLSSGTTLSY